MPSSLKAFFNSRLSTRATSQDSPSSVESASAEPIYALSNLGLQALHRPPVATVDIVFVHGLTGDSFNTWYDEKARIYWPRDLLRSDLADARIFSYGYDADVTSFWGQTSKNRLGEHAQNLLGDLVREREETDTEDRQVIFVAHSLGGLVVQKTLTLSRSRAEPHLKRIEACTTGIVFLGTPHNGSDLAGWAVVCTRLISRFKEANPEILAVLQQESEVLRDTQDGFGQLLESRKYEGTKINITCFFEELAVSAVGPVSSITYHDWNLPPDQVDCAHVFRRTSRVRQLRDSRQSHENMTKFSFSTEIGYKRVVGELRRWAKSIRSPPKLEPTLDEAKKERARQEECLRSLYYEGMNARYQTLASAHDETLGWIWSRPGLWFGKWLQAGHGVYWITGKPGSGKSTLMKYLADGSQRIATELSHPTFRNSASSQSAQPLTASYFFDFRASDLARSIEGLLRSLLWQLLRQDTKFYKPVMPIYQDIESFKSRFAWTRHDLQLAFQQLLNAAKNINVVIFIDALDEFGGPDIEIAEFLDALSKKAPALTRFCLASRPYPDFAFQFAKCFHLQMQEETYADITKYLHGRFSEMQDIHGSNAWTLMDTIRRKAEGVFLWIKLVCDNLQGGWRRFETFEELLQRIDHLPRDLSTLYQRIFDEMLEDEQEQARRMLEVVAHSVRPLSFLEFYYALGYSYEAIRDSGNSQCCCTVCRNRTRVRLFIDSVERQVSDLRKIPPNVERAMMGRIQAICRGLVDVQSGRPRLLHETVSAYLSQALQHGGTCTNYDSNIVSGDSLLLAACTKFGATLFTDHWPLLEPSESSRNKVCITSVCRGSPGQATLPLSENSVLVVDVTECRLALLDYALKYWLIHAKRTGARTGDGCNWILNQLSGPPFAAWSTLILHYNRWLSDLRPIDLLEMAIYFDLDKYATTELQAPLPTPRSLPHHSHPVHTLLPSMCASSVHRNYGRYLFAVAKSGNYNLAGLLLKYDKASTPARSSVHELNGRLGICRTPNATLTTDEYGKFALHRAIFFGHKSIVELLLNHGVDQALKIGSPNLREFLECGSSIIIENGDCELPPDVKLLRCMARAKGLYDGSFNWLRNNYKASLWGPTVYSTYEWTNSPLELTVRCNYIDEHDAFYTLLGAFQPGVPHASLNSTMTAAAFHGLTEYVQALLSHGVKPNITCYSARFCLLSGTHMCNPLLSAISNGHFEVVGLLLDYGADPNTIINCPSGTQISALETALECWDAVGDGDLFLEIALSYIICKLYWHGARVREESIEALVLKFPEMFQDLDKTLLLDHMDELRGMLEEHRDERWPPKNSPPKSKQPDYLILRDP